MPLLALTVIGLMLLGNVFAGSPDAPAQEPAAPYAHPVNLQTEMSAPMFHGTVQAIDRKTLRVTIRTDFGRLVPVALESCEIVQRLRIGDRVRLDVDAQGAVRALEKADSYLATDAHTPRSSTATNGRCPEASL
ncbi:MAG: hypothetical protein ACREI9_08590 [Nitrospiraceae bacterium]